MPLDTPEAHWRPLSMTRSGIATGLSQRERARRLGHNEQQMQRDEATAYASVSLARLHAVLQVVGRQRHETILWMTHLRLSEPAVPAVRLGGTESTGEEA
jgi:hypothetical protein